MNNYISGDKFVIEKDYWFIYYKGVKQMTNKKALNKRCAYRSKGTNKDIRTNKLDTIK